MTIVLRKIVLMLLAGAGFASVSAQSEPAAPPSLTPPREVVEWVSRYSVPTHEFGDEMGTDERRIWRAIMRGTRILGFGENAHGSREPLAYRNRLIRTLVRNHGLTAVALESGLAESRQLYDYVLGGPGDGRALVRTGLTHGFGNLRENLELVEWLRQHNRAHPRRPVRLYGIDHSTILSAAPGVGGHGVVLEHIEDYLARTIPTQSQNVRASLVRMKSTFTEVDWPRLTAEEKAVARTTLTQTLALFERHRAAMVRASNRSDYAWAKREAYDAARLPLIFDTWTDDPTQLERLARVIELRDLAMADHTQWVLDQEGRKGKVLLFQTNGHVAAAPLVGSVMRLFPLQPKVTGTVLRGRMGHAYKAIATVSSRGLSADDPASGSIDRAFAANGRSPVLLRLKSPKRSAWWAHLQSASQGVNRVDEAVPAEAFDGLVYFATLTPVEPLAELVK